MNAESDARRSFAERIEKLEAGYEYFLAYAAQGRTSDRGSGGRADVRAHLEACAEALAGLGDVATACVAEREAATAEAARPFLDALAADAEVTLGVIRLVLAQADISSQLIDNLNASIHLRALLTDVFIVDEALRGPPAGASS